MQQPSFRQLFLYLIYCVKFECHSFRKDILCFLNLMHFVTIMYFIDNCRIAVFWHPEHGSSLVCVRPSLNFETRKLTVENEDDQYKKRTSNLNLIFVAVFPSKWKNFYYRSNLFLSILECSHKNVCQNHTITDWIEVWSWKSFYHVDIIIFRKKSDL